MCTPRTWADAGRGVHDDGCGGTLDCGSCPPPACEPRTCRSLGRVCGFDSDGCGGYVDCGPCAPHMQARERLGEAWGERDQDCSVDGRCRDGRPIYR